MSYIGRLYQLTTKIDEIKSITFKFIHGKFFLTLPYNNDINISKKRKAAVKLFKENAMKKIYERIEYYYPKVGKAPKEIRIREFKARWGHVKRVDPLISIGG